MTDAARRMRNLYKGTNLTTVDPETNQIVRLFNPRIDSWAAHFKWSRAVLVGITAEGRGTVALLNINLPQPLRVRVALMAAGDMPQG